MGLSRTNVQTKEALQTAVQPFVHLFILHFGQPEATEKESNVFISVDFLWHWKGTDH